jgi:regulator of extracellular matrix RemA (YlzA/DUF370 family)
MSVLSTINVGSSNFVASQKVVAIVNSESAPLRKLIQTLRGSGQIIDATQGKKTRSIVVTEGQFFVLSTLEPEELASRLKEALGG